MGISLNLCSVYDLQNYIFKKTSIPEIKKNALTALTYYVNRYCFSV